MGEKIMLVKVFFTENCINTVFTQTGKEIGKEREVEINFEQFTHEFRELFLLYTEKWERYGTEVGRQFKLRTDVYPIDICSIVNEMALLIEKSKSAAIEAAREENGKGICTNISYGKISYEIHHAATKGCLCYGSGILFECRSRWFEFSATSYEDENGMLKATKEQLLSVISPVTDTGMTDDELKSAIADAILAKMGEYNEEVVAKIEREALERRKKEQREAENRAYIEQRAAWIETHGSDYLKALLKEGLRVRDVFVKEFEDYESRHIFELKGIANTLHTDEELDSDKDTRIITKRIELTGYTLDEEQLRKYVAVKQCEGFKDAYIQKVKTISYYDDEPTVEYKLVAEFKTVLGDFEIELL